MGNHKFLLTPVVDRGTFITHLAFPASLPQLLLTHLLLSPFFLNNNFYALIPFFGVSVAEAPASPP
jgi:hypothetical protein